MPALPYKTVLLLALICSHALAGVIAEPLNASNTQSKSFRSGVIAQSAVKQFEGNDRAGKAVLDHDFESRNSLARILDERIL